MTAVLQVRDLTVDFAGADADVPAVRGVDLDVAAQEVVALVGESGSGKSATALAIMGLLPDDARVTGSVRLHGHELLGRSDRAMSAVRGAGIGMVFQDPMSALTPVHTVGAQIAEAVRVHARTGRHRPGRAALRARTAELLALVGLDPAARYADAYPHQLSGGQRQRVVIAIAVANDPDLLLCDEPTTALDVTVQAQILDVLRAARDATGAGLLLITHDLGVVADIADRAVVMYAGRAVETAPVDVVFDAPRMPYTVGLLGSVPRLDAARGDRLVPIPGVPPARGDLGPGCPFAPRCPLADDDCLVDEPALREVGTAHRAACLHTDAVAGRTAAEVYARPGRAASASGAAAPAGRADAAEAPVVLAVRDLRHTYARRGGLLRRRGEDVRAVDGVSVTLRRGRTLGIVGESGSGKTTTVHDVLALVPPQSGTVEVLGHDVACLDRRQRRALRGELQAVFQDPVAALDPRLPVGDVLAEPLRAAGVDGVATAARIAELLDLVGLRAADAARWPGEFSGGQRQRIGIARALATSPRIVALDEPVSALDVSVQAGILNLLLDLQDRLGLAYLFVSHDLSVVRHLAHDVAVMHRGVVVEQGDADAVFGDPRHDYTRALLAAVPGASRR